MYLTTDWGQILAGLIPLGFGAVIILVMQVARSVIQRGELREVVRLRQQLERSQQARATIEAAGSAAVNADALERIADSLAILALRLPRSRWEELATLAAQVALVVGGVVTLLAFLHH